MADGGCILGDSAFAESPWLRTPIPAPSTRSERFFNWKHSSIRFRVEHAFGRLKWKFPALKRGLLFKLDHAPVIMDTCVVLYNFFLAHEGDLVLRIRRRRPDEGGRGLVGRTRAERWPWCRRRVGDRGGGRLGLGINSPLGAVARGPVSNRCRILMRDWGTPGSRADRTRVQDEARGRRWGSVLEATGAPAPVVWQED